MIFLGYRAKRRWLPDPAWDPDGLTGVRDVCSASDCLANPPPDWEKRWDLNAACCYDNPSQAGASVPSGERSEYAILAYWLLPESGMDAKSFFDPDLPPVPGDGGPVDYERLGYDVVEMAVGPAAVPRRLPPFGHSPLSCNLLAREIPVNACCLVDQEAEALRLVERFNREQPEPGTYFAVLIARAREKLER